MGNDFYMKWREAKDAAEAKEHVAQPGETGSYNISGNDYWGKTASGAEVYGNTGLTNELTPEYKNARRNALLEIANRGPRTTWDSNHKGSSYNGGATTTKPQEEPYGPKNPWNAGKTKTIVDQFKELYPGQPYEGLTEDQMLEYIEKYQKANPEKENTRMEEFRDIYGYLPPDYMSEFDLNRATGNININPGSEAARFAQQRGEETAKFLADEQAKRNRQKTEQAQNAADLAQERGRALTNKYIGESIQTPVWAFEEDLVDNQQPAWKGPRFEYHPEDQIGSSAWEAQRRGRSMTDYYRDQLLQEQLKNQGYDGDPHALATSPEVLASEEGPWGYLADIANGADVNGVNTYPQLNTTPNKDASAYWQSNRDEVHDPYSWERRYEADQAEAYARRILEEARARENANTEVPENKPSPHTHPYYETAYEPGTYPTPDTSGYTPMGDLNRTTNGSGQMPYTPAYEDGTYPTPDTSGYTPMADLNRATNGSGVTPPYEPAYVSGTYPTPDTAGYTPMGDLNRETNGAGQTTYTPAYEPGTYPTSDTSGYTPVSDLNRSTNGYRQHPMPDNLEEIAQLESQARLPNNGYTPVSTMPEATGEARNPLADNVLRSNGYVPVSTMPEATGTVSSEPEYVDPNTGRPMYENSYSRALADNQYVPDANIFRQDVMPSEEEMNDAYNAYLGILNTNGRTYNGTSQKSKTPNNTPKRGRKYNGTSTKSNG